MQESGSRELDMSDNVNLNCLVSLLKALDSSMLTNSEWEELAAVESAR